MSERDDYWDESRFHPEHIDDNCNANPAGKPFSDGGAAFPVHGGCGGQDDYRNRILGGGMSKREMIATHALAGMATSAGYQGLPWDKVASEAVAAADALLAALEAPHV